MKKLRIHKVVVPVAGLGTRLYPLTRTTPKALVLVGGKPLVEYVLEEARESGFDEVILVISPEHRARFQKYLARARRRFPHTHFDVKLQERANGNGEAILRAAGAVAGEPFGLRFCDDVLFGREPILKTLRRFFLIKRAPLMLLERIPWSKVHNYGVVGVQEKTALGLRRITEIVEKPKTSERKAPSNLTVVGAYLLTPKIIELLVRASRFAPPLKDALPLTVAFHDLIDHGEKIYGWEFSGTRFDCGNLDGLRRAEEFLRGIKHTGA